MVKIGLVCLAIALPLAAGGCQNTPPRRHTVTTADGQVFRGARCVWFGDGYGEFRLADGRKLLAAGSHVAVEERQAEEEKQ